MTDEIKQRKGWDAAMDRLKDAPANPSLHDVASTLSSTAHLMQALHSEVREMAITQAIFRQTLTSLEETLRELRKWFNAAEPTSLPIRLAVLEHYLASHKEWQKEHEAEAQTLAQERARESWQLRVAVITSGISFLGSIVVLALSLLLKR